MTRPTREIYILHTIVGHVLVYTSNHMNVFRSSSYKPTIVGCYMRVAEYNAWPERECDMVLLPEIRNCLP